MICKSYKLIVMILISTLFFTGCFNYRDINKVVFTISFVVDIDESENIFIYAETFKPTRTASQSSETGVRIISKGKGKTLFEAIRDLNLSSSYKNNYTQNKAVIFTERAARKGIDKVIDLIDRDQEFLIHPYVYVYMGDVEELLKTEFKDDEYLGMYLFNLINNIGASSRAAKITINKLLNYRMRGSKTLVIPVIKMLRNSIDKKIQLSGAAIIKEDTMVDYLTIGENQGYNFLTNQVRTGTLEVTNPSKPDMYVTLEIIGSKTKTTINYDKDKIKLMKKIVVKTSVAEAQGRFTLTRKDLQALEINAEDNIERYCSKVFNDYKQKNIDIFEVKSNFFRHYPNIKIDDPILECHLELDVHVNIEGSSNKTNKG